MNIRVHRLVYIFSTSVELEPENVCLFVCLSVPNFGAANLVDLDYSHWDFWVFGISEDIPRGYFFCLAQF